LAWIASMPEIAETEDSVRVVRRVVLW
jgi:hypothetical protein